MSPRRAKATLSRVDEDPATALREHLVDAAERLLETHQVGQITTRLLASSAGVSDGVLYNYFAGKNDVLVAALLRRYEASLARYDTDLPEPGSATVEANLVAYVEAGLDLVGRTMPVAAGLMSEPELLHRFMAAIHSHPFGVERVVQPLAAYLAGEQELGRLRRVPVEAVIPLVLGTAMTFATSDLMGQTLPGTRETRVRDVVRVLLAGLGPDADDPRVEA